MPMENFHSARLRDPSDFDPDSYRYTRGGTIYGRIRVPKTIDIVWAKLKGHAKPKDPPMPQALRFPSEKWTVAEAKKWLKDNNVKYERFEPAKESKHSGSDNVLKFAGGQNKAPIGACVFNGGDAACALTADDQDKKILKIVAYSGGIIKNHWFWGDTIFDLEGLKFSKARTPILHEHFTSSRIAFTTKQEISKNVSAEATWLDNVEARALRDDMIAGFPMEASLHVPPLVVENVNAGIEVEVNGLNFKGPGTIFRKALIREISICVLGADAKTKATAYSQDESEQIAFTIKENEIMAKTDVEMTIETFTAQYPDMHGEIFNAGKAEGLAEGRQKVSDLFKELQAACGTDYELIVSSFSGGKTAEQARALMIEKLKQTNAKLAEDLSRAQKTRIDPAIQEFTQGSPAPGTGRFDETKATNEQLKDHFGKTQELQDEFSSADAYIAAVHHPAK